MIDLLFTTKPIKVKDLETGEEYYINLCDINNTFEE